jgi:predicted dehydrogenase
MKSIGLGVVGAGAIAQRGIFPHLSLPDVQDKVRLVGVCDPAPGRAQAAAERWSVPFHCADLGSLLAHPEVDAVTIASPIGLHFDQGREAIMAGKHVHFNKTMTTTELEAKLLMDLAAARNVKIVASPGEILRPQIHRIRELIQSGAIGIPCWAVCGGSFGRYHEEEHEFRAGSDALTSVNPMWYYRKPGGGPLYDIVSYSLHALTAILGPVKQVTAMSGIRIRTREFGGQEYVGDADDNSLAILAFGESLFAFVHGTPVGNLTDSFYPRIFGSEGVIDGLLLNGRPFDYPGKEIADSMPGWNGEQAVLPHVVGDHRNLEEQHVFEDIMQLVDWVREGKESPVNAERARHVIEVIEAIYLSSEHSQAIPISSAGFQ